MRARNTIGILALLAACAGGWLLVREHIRATAVAGTTHDQVKPHQDQPPHGGTPVVLGDEAFHLELVRDSATGTLQAYVLDGEMEDFIRIGAARLDLEVERAGGSTSLPLLPVADPATGETIGNTCLFQAKADWLKTTDHFRGTFRNLKIQDQTFPKVDFRFPEGNAKD